MFDKKKNVQSSIGEPAARTMVRFFSMLLVLTSPKECWAHAVACCRHPRGLEDKPRVGAGCPSCRLRRELDFAVYIFPLINLWNLRPLELPGLLVALNPMKLKHFWHKAVLCRLGPILILRWRNSDAGGLCDCVTYNRQWTGDFCWSLWKQSIQARRSFRTLALQSPNNTSVTILCPMPTDYMQACFTLFSPCGCQLPTTQID